MSLDRVSADLESLMAAPGVGWAFLLAYLSGSIPFGFLLTRALAGRDIRTVGSGNIGATNVSRVLGKKIGGLTLLLDAAKGALPVLVVGRYFTTTTGDPHLAHVIQAWVGVVALLGHCFPVWLRFRGGKGVATGIGVLVAHDVLIAAAGFAAFGVVVALTRVVSLGSLAALVAVVPAYWVLVGGVPDGRSVAYAGMILLIAGKHHGNIRRLLRKEESRL